MSTSKKNKMQIIWLRLRIAMSISIISFIAIVGPPFIIMRLNIEEDLAFNLACANLIFMPIILFIVTLIIGLVCKLNKNVSKEVKEKYTLLPFYYVFFTPVFSMLLMWIIDRII